MPAKRYCKGRYFDVLADTEFEFVNGLYLEGDNDAAIVQLGDGRIITPEAKDIKLTDLDLRYGLGVIKRCSGI